MTEFSGMAVLVTGGTGSLGKRLVWELLQHGAMRVTVLSRDEKKQYDMGKQCDDRRLSLVIGDVRDGARVGDVVRQGKFDAIVHAAALKHVIGCEQHPMEAVKTNVLGIENVVRAARAYDVPRVVAISTDKACKPVNVMGMTKALMERVAISRGYSCVRYGNVIGSRGSVIPFFTKLLNEHAPSLPITSFRMTRFLMTLGDAVDLVTRTLTDWLPATVRVHKAGAVRIVDLVGALVQRLKVPMPELEEVGFVHGEKLDEVLVAHEESPRAYADGDDGIVIRPRAQFSTEPLPGDGSYGSASHLLRQEQIISILERAEAEAVAAKCPWVDGWFTKG